MYGVTFKANKDIDSNEPPVNEFNKLKESPNDDSKNALIWELSIPGIGN